MLFRSGYRMELREQNRIEFLTGKAEFIRRGHFDDVDMALMCHTKNDDTASHVANSSNGAVIKKIRFLGKASHAGAHPQAGINALNAANLAMTAIALLRETFYDEDTIRIHPIITHGGDAVSAVPAEVIVETFVRGRTLEGIVDANKKVDRAVRGAAMAIGASAEIETTAGYLPQTNNRTMSELWGQNVKSLYGEDQFYIEDHRTGSTDMGDLGHIISTIYNRRCNSSTVYKRQFDTSIVYKRQFDISRIYNRQCRTEERRVGKECRPRWSPEH